MSLCGKWCMSAWDPHEDIVMHNNLPWNSDWSLLLKVSHILVVQAASLYKNGWLKYNSQMTIKGNFSTTGWFNITGPVIVIVNHLLLFLFEVWSDLMCLLSKRVIFTKLWWSCIGHLAMFDYAKWFWDVFGGHSWLVKPDRKRKCLFSMKGL